MLAELFTSEGCSSCPPADKMLGQIDEMQPITGEHVIVLGEHVDYWNHDGWKDAYSSAYFTQRQTDYVRRFGVKEPYTPEMVIDGAAQVSGNDGPAVQSALEKARGTAKVPVKISGVAVEGGKTVRAHLMVDELPADFKAKKADVVVAIALDHVETHVGAGENKGRDIKSVAVAQSIEKVGTVEKGKGFDRDVTVKVKSAADAGNLRVIAFVQGADTGEVMGVAMENPAKAGAAGGSDAR